MSSDDGVRGGNDSSPHGSSSEENKVDKDFLELKGPEGSPDDKSPKRKKMKLVQGSESENDEEIPDYDPELMVSMRNLDLFLLLARRDRITAGDRLLVKATKNLIAGEFKFFCISMSETPANFKEVLGSRRLPSIFLFRGFDIVSTLNIEATAEDIAARVEENRN